MGVKRKRSKRKDIGDQKYGWVLCYVIEKTTEEKTWQGQKGDLKVPLEREGTPKKKRESTVRRGGNCRILGYDYHKAAKKPTN